MYVKNQEIAALNPRARPLQRGCVGDLANEDENNGIAIIAKGSEAARYLYMSLCRHHCYRRHKNRVLLARNQVSTLFIERDAPNFIVTYNFWRDHQLFVVYPNRPRHF